MICPESPICQVQALGEETWEASSSLPISIPLFTLLSNTTLHFDYPAPYNPFISPSGVLLRVCFASWQQLTQTTLSSSKVSSLWISVVTTFTCTGEILSLPFSFLESLLLTHLPSICFHLVFPLLSSLLSGSESHKKVTATQSRILWYYYNDSVSLLANFVPHYVRVDAHSPHFPLSLTEHFVLLLRW